MKKTRVLLFSVAVALMVLPCAYLMFAAPVRTETVFDAVDVTSATGTSREINLGQWADISGYLGLHLTVTNSGVVTLVQAEVSPDGSTWVALTSTAYAVFSDLTSVSGPAADGSVAMQLSVIPAPWIRFKAVVTGGTANIDGDLVIH